MLDYMTLKMIWWALAGLFLIGFALTGGFDLGIATLLPFIGKNDDERRVVINSIGPFWDGNQVWLVTVGGVFFAAWPLIYAAAFSGFYFAMMLLILALILRPVGFDYRGKIANPAWRRFWDRVLFISGLLPALVFGVAFGNLLQGVPLSFDAYMRPSYDGMFIALFNPFALLCGLVSLAMLIQHGAAFLRLRTESSSPIYQRGGAALRWSALFYALLFILGGIWVSQMEGFRLVAMPDPGAVVTPLMQEVERGKGLWLANYSRFPVVGLIPVLALLGAGAAWWFGGRNRDRLAFLSSGLCVSMTVIIAPASMFPFLMPSNVAPSQSLTVWNAVSSRLTLEIMLYASIILLPIVLLYTGWVYRVMGGRLNSAQVSSDKNLY